MNYVAGYREMKFTRKLKKSNNKEFSSVAWNWENCDTLDYTMSTDAMLQK